MQELLSLIWPPVFLSQLSVILIWTLGLRSLWILAVNRTWLLREQKALETVRDRFVTLQKEAIAQKQEVAPSLAVAIKEADARDSLLNRMATVLWDQRAMKMPDLEGILVGVEEEADQHWAFARIVPNLVLLLGLLGTIVGLSQIVHDIGPAIRDAANAANSSTGGAPAGALQELSKPVALLGGAFACTLHGIIWAVIIAWYAHYIESRQTILLNSLRNFLLRDLARHFLPESLEHQIRSLSNSLERTLGSLRDTLSSNVLSLQSSITQSVELMKGVTTGINTAAAALDKATQHATKKMEEVTTTVSRSADQLAASINATEKLQHRVHETYTSLMQQHEASQDSFKRRADEIIAVLNQQRTDFNTNTGAILASLLAAQSAFKDGAEKFETAGIHFQNTSQTIGVESYRAIAERADSFLTGIDRHTRATELVEGQVRELLNRLDPRLLPREEWDGIMQALNRVAVATEDAAIRETHYQAALDSYGGVAANIGSEMVDVKSWLTERLPNVKERQVTINQMIKSIEDLEATMTEVGSKITGSDVVEQGTLQQAVRESSEQIVGRLAGLENWLNARLPERDGWDIAHEHIKQTLHFVQPTPSANGDQRPSPLEAHETVKPTPKGGDA